MADQEKRKGRPPRGEDKCYVSGYPQLGIRVPPRVKADLRRAAGIERRAQWEILTSAMDLYMAAHHPVKKIVEEVLTGV